MKELLKRIEVTRARLNFLVLNKGFKHKEVIETSEYLDQLLNEYHTLSNCEYKIYREVACSSKEKKKIYDNKK